MRTLAIIPARGNSKRFARKNIALLNGKPLVSHAIEAAKNSGVFNEIVVSSEDDEILQLAELLQVYPYRRSDSLSEDTVTVADVCADVLEHYKEIGKYFSFFAVLLPTSPLRSAEDIQAAWKVYSDSSNANTLMSVTPLQHLPHHALGLYFNYGAWKVKPMMPEQIDVKRQQLPECYRHDGAIIISSTEYFLSNRDFYAGNVLAYLTPLEKSVDINTPLDLEWAEFLLQRRAVQCES